MKGSGKQQHCSAESSHCLVTTPEEIKIVATMEMVEKIEGSDDTWPIHHMDPTEEPIPSLDPQKSGVSPDLELSNEDSSLSGGAETWIVEGNKKYKCNYCNKEFTTAQSLGGHQNAHKQERALANRRRELLQKLASEGPFYLHSQTSSFRYHPYYPENYSNSNGYSYLYGPSEYNKSHVIPSLLGSTTGHNVLGQGGGTRRQSQFINSCGFGGGFGGGSRGWISYKFGRNVSSALIHNPDGSSSMVPRSETKFGQANFVGGLTSSKGNPLAAGEQRPSLSSSSYKTPNCNRGDANPLLNLGPSDVKLVNLDDDLD